MISFNLFEGLIKAPPNIYKDFRGIHTGTYYVCSRTGTRERQSNHQEGCITVSSQGSKFSKQPKVNKYRYVDPHMDLPPQYQHDEVDDDPRYLNLQVVLTPSRDRADYEPSKMLITIYLATYVDEVLGMVDRESDLEKELVKMCSIIENDVKHELMHYVQDVSLAYKHQKQNQGPKGTSTKAYFLSPQEFDPTIRSEVGEFQARVQRPYTPAKIKDYTSKSEFFKILKKHDKKRYQLAMKKFGTEIGR